MAEPADVHPFVHWGQNETHVFLSIRIQDAQDVEVKIEDELFYFEGIGTGAHGHRTYKFSLAYYLPVIAKESRFTVTGRDVQIKLRKEYRETWPRLTLKTDRAPWICLDFDLYQFDASDLETEDEEEAEAKRRRRRQGVDELKTSTEPEPDNVEIKVIRPSKEERDRHNAEMKALEDEEMWEAFLKILRHPVTIYLVLFNLFQFAGFLCIWGKLMLHYFQVDSSDTLNWYDFVLPRLVVVQLVQFLEPIHTLIGWIRSNALTSTLQVVGRCFVLLFVVLPHPDLASGTTVFWLFFAWSSIELVRYPYYTVSLLGFRSNILTYLRYTIWIPLYPLGFMCQGFLIVRALPILSKSRRFCIDLPNPSNMSVDFPLLMQVWLIGMLAAFYKLMRYMYVQRRRVIGPRPRMGADQLGFFSFIPMLRSLISGKNASLDGPKTQYHAPRRILSTSKRNVPLPKLQ